MVRYRSRVYRSDVRRYAYFGAVAMILLAVFLLIADIRIRPYIRLAAQNAALNLAMSAINDAVSEVINEEEITYDMLAVISTDSGGRITSVKIDALKINTLKSKVNARIIDKIGQVKGYEMSLPTGSLFGSDFWAGWGPDINFELSLTGNSTSNICSEFSASGINQTLHRIVVRINASVQVVLPSNRTSINVSTDMCIAETVIVGIVPNASAQLG